MNLLKSLAFNASLFTFAAASAQVQINIDANNRGPKISPTHYGIFFEDINHAADGGIYAELIRNRSFEDNENVPEAWKASHIKDGKASIELTAESPMNAAHEKSLRVIVTKADDQNLAGASNTGYWGINSVKGTTYKLSFWAKSDTKFKGTLKAVLHSDYKGAPSLGEVSIPVKLSAKWQKYTATITATGNDPKAVFDILSNATGTFQLDVVSLFPPTYKDRPNGMRPDLAGMLEAMHPKFMRFPGGCFVEGQVSPENAFRWERTIGDIENRPGHKNVNWGYRTSDGMGFHEYLQLAEDLGAKPLYVVNVGIWHGGYTPLDSIQPWIDECLNALEYANGPVTSKYGALRAKNGHPEPFNIEYLEIGNENYNFFMDTNRDQSIQYPERYKKFYDAVKAKYPNIKAIGNVQAWGTDEPTWRNNYPVDLLDEHYYRNPKWFADRFHKYDTYSRKGPKVYVGEYAVTSMFGKVGNLNAALGEAVYMMGMENNSDVVALNSYAPIFVNENNVAWRPDMIRFNSKDCMGTPSYYVQMLFPNNIGTQVVKTDWTADLPIEPQEKAKAEEPQHIGFGSWATTATYKDVQYIVDGKEVKLSDISKWENKKGRWSVANGELTQDSRDEAAMYICPDALTNKKYTIKAKAMKKEGNEGFLVVFGYKDNDTYNWFNVGGWSNSRNNIEQGVGGGRTQIANEKKFEVEPNKWYDLQVDVYADTIVTYIDGKEECRGVLQHSMMKGVYASTTIDDATNTMYIKVVNTGYGPTSGTINLKHALASSATLTRLSSASGDDENTMQNPTAITPCQAPVKIGNNGSQLLFDVPSYSLCIIKAQLK